MAHLDKSNPDSGLGRGETPGDDFCLFDEKLGSSREQAHVFLHELTHNLMGNYFGVGSTEKEHNPSASHLIDTDQDPEAEHCTHNDCALQTHLSSSEREQITNLCDDCWDAIRFDGRDRDFTD